MIGATVMTGHEGGLRLPINQKAINSIRAAHENEMDDLCEREFNYGLECFTQAESGHFRKAESAIALRNRIAAAREAGGLSANAAVSERQKLPGSEEGKPRLDSSVQNLITKPRL